MVSASYIKRLKTVSFTITPSTENIIITILTTILFIMATTLRVQFNPATTLPLEQPNIIQLYTQAQASTQALRPSRDATVYS